MPCARRAKLQKRGCAWAQLATLYDLGALRGRDHRPSFPARREAPASGSATGSTGRRPRTARVRAPGRRQGREVCPMVGVRGKCDPSRGDACGRRAAGRDGRDVLPDCADGGPWQREPTGDELPSDTMACSRHGRGRTPRRWRRGGCTDDRLGLFAGGGEILRLGRSEVPRHRRRVRRSPRPRVVRHHPTRLPVPGGASRRSSMRRGSSAPTPARPRSPGSGLVAVLSVRRGAGDALFHEPHVLRLALLVRLAPADGDESPAAGGRGRPGRTPPPAAAAAARAMAGDEVCGPEGAGPGRGRRRRAPGDAALGRDTSDRPKDSDGNYLATCQAQEPAHSGETDHPFRPKPITHSGRNRSPVPAETDHPVRSEATRDLNHQSRFSRFVSPPVSGGYRMESPFVSSRGHGVRVGRN